MLFLLPVLTGLSLAFCFPGIGLGHLAWVVYIPLIAFVRASRGNVQAFMGGGIAGVISHMALLVWIPEVLHRYGGLPQWLSWGALFLMACVLAFFPALACGLTRQLIKRGGDRYLLLLPGAWVVSEYLLSRFPFGGFPWILAGYSQWNCLRLIQIADITGIYGVSFVVLWTATALVWLVANKGKSAGSYVPLAMAAALVLGCLTYGSHSLQRWGSVPAAYRVAMLQGNLRFEDSDAVLADKMLHGYVRMADTLAPGEADLLLLPESPSPGSSQFEDSYRHMLEDLARRYPMGLIFNGVRSVETAEGFKFFNSAFLLDGRGSLTAVYDKIHLVPFGEYVPLAGLWGIADAITREVGEFSPGWRTEVVEIGGHPANVLICFEAVFPDLTRRFVREGSQLIVNLTNDGWYGKSAAPYQHLAISRLRAIENRRYLLRATNTGISAVIEPSGEIQASTGLLEEAVGKGRFGFVAHETFYARYGDVFVLACAIISIGLWILSEFHCALKNKRKTMGD